MEIKNYRDRDGAGKKISFVDFEEYFMIRKFLPSKIEYLVFENYCRIEGKMFGYLFYEDEYYHINPIVDGYYTVIKEIKERVKDKIKNTGWKEGDDDDGLFEICSPYIGENTPMEMGDIPSSVYLSLNQIYTLLSI